MFWQCGGPAILVAIKDVGTLLTNSLETKAQKHPLHGFEINQGQFAQTETSIC